MAQVKTWRWSALTAVLVMSLGSCGEITIADSDDEDTSGNNNNNQCSVDSDCESKKLACHSSAFCDQGTCSFTVANNSCLIKGECVESGDNDFGNQCLICEPTTNVGDYTSVTCPSGEMCNPESGQCAGPQTDIVDSDMLDPDVAPPMDVPDVDDVQPDIPDMNMPDVGPDVPNPIDTDTGGPDIGPVCQTNADCESSVDLSPCEGVVCIAAAGTCAVFTLPENSACGLGAGSSDCSSGLCDAAGECIGEPLSNTSCDDNDLCTIGDVCQDGLCVGASKNCNDENPCTQDSCSADSGACTSTPWMVDVGSEIPCDDGYACTDGDSCDGGVCESGGNQCDCDTDADCVDNGNLCKGTLECVDVAGSKKCVVNESSKITCDVTSDDSCN
ncbi:MAG: hypothetical protein ACI9OJ_004655, partial [Myxococcota bacterium]